MGRYRIAERAGMLERGIHDPFVPSQVEAFVKGNLPGMLIDFSFYDEGRLTLACVDLDDTIRQVTIFYRRYAGDDLDALNVRGADGAR